MNNSDNHINRNANNTSSRTNQSLQQSLYIAALDRQIGMRGFIPAVTDAVGNLDYDFLHMQSGRFVKLFKELHAEEMARYEQFRPDLAPIYIVEASGLSEQERKGIKRLGRMQFCTHSKELSDAIMLFRVLLFKDECLWEWDGGIWVKIATVEMQRCLCALYKGDDE
jgi:hypothetical protein